MLRDAIAGQTIVETTTLVISTTASPPLIGGGADNIAFLKPNADAVQMTAIFWIETVEHTLTIPGNHVPLQPILLRPHGGPGALTPSFTITPPHGIGPGHVIKVHSKQIQYTQNVFLNFKGLTWPHVSVATLVPSNAIPAPWP